MTQRKKMPRMFEMEVRREQFALVTIEAKSEEEALRLAIPRAKEENNWGDPAYDTWISEEL